MGCSYRLLGNVMLCPYFCKGEFHCNVNGRFMCVLELAMRAKFSLVYIAVVVSLFCRIMRRVHDPSCSSSCVWASDQAIVNNVSL
jgi:hypothetical protein